MQRQDIQEVHLIHAGEDPETLLKPLATGIEKYLKQQDLVTYETFTTNDAGSESVSEKVAEAIRDAEEKKIPSAVIISKKFLSTLFLNKNKDHLIELLVDDHSYSELVPIWLGVDEEEIKRYSSRLASKRPVRGEHYTPHSHNFQILAETLVMAWLGKYIPSEGDESIAENHLEHLRSREPVESEDPSSVEEPPATDVSGENAVDTRPSDLHSETATSTEGRPANLQQEENESASCAAAMAGSGLHTNYAEGLDKLDSEEGAKKGDGAGADPTQPHPSDLPNEAAASGEARPANQQQEEEGDSGCSDKAIGAGGCHMDPEKGLSYLNRDAEDSCHGSQGVPSMGSRNAATACAPAAAATRQPAAPIAGGEAAAPTVPAGPAAAGEQVQARSAPGKPDKPKPANIPIGGPLNDATDKELKSPIPVNGHDNKEHRCPTSEGIVPPNAFYVGTSDPSQDTPSPPQDPQAEYMVDLDQDILDDLKMKLDPQMPLIKNWRNFGSRNGIKNQELNYIDHCARQGQSPTVAIFQKLSHLTVKKFKEDCKFYKRMDVLEVMKRHGY